MIRWVYYLFLFWCAIPNAIDSFSSAPIINHFIQFRSNAIRKRIRSWSNYKISFLLFFWICFSHWWWFIYTTYLLVCYKIGKISNSDNTPVESVETTTSTSHTMNEHDRNLQSILTNEVDPHYNHFVGTSTPSATEGTTHQFTTESMTSEFEINSNQSKRLIQVQCVQCWIDMEPSMMINVHLFCTHKSVRSPHHPCH